MTHNTHTHTQSHAPAKVAELEDASGDIEEEVLWFDVAVADAEAVHKREGAVHLIHRELQAHTAQRGERHTK